MLHIALIRGINVGKAKRVAMADLRTLVEQLGYGDCRTLLNSGNVVYDSKDDAPAVSAARIEQAMAEELGIEAPVIALNRRDFETVIEENSLVEMASDPSRLLVAFLRDSADRARLEPLTACDWEPEALALGGRAAYLWCPDGILESRLPEEIGRTLGKAVTSRNWKTVQKIAAVLSS